MCNQESENAICQVAHTKKYLLWKWCCQDSRLLDHWVHFDFCYIAKKKKKEKKKGFQQEKVTPDGKTFDPKANKTSKNQVNKFPDHEKISRER